MRLNNDTALNIYNEIRNLPIISPHGHCDPGWFAQDIPFSDPSQLLVVPDHYVFRMLYSQGIPLEKLGIPPKGDSVDPRSVFRVFANNWHLFLGTPSRTWIEFVLHETLGITLALSADTADAVYDQIDDKLSDPSFRPRALFDRFNIEVLATTDHALDDLADHKAIAASGWDGRVIPTFRPDALIDPLHPEFRESVAKLADQTGKDTKQYVGYLEALASRREYFREMGATATDHAIDVLQTGILPDPETVFTRLFDNPKPEAARAFHGHMLIKMAEMSAEDGMVMQLHAGSQRNTNDQVFRDFGPDKGADVPRRTNWVDGLGPLLNRVGNSTNFKMIAFTLDESTYARELAPMAGHWPCLRIGPPWWFHDSAAGIGRYFDQVVETAGYWNLAGFNDDTRAFMSIPARHDLWRRVVSAHLSEQVQKGYFEVSTAHDIAKLLAVDLARESYRL